MPNPLEYNVVETPKAALAGDAGLAAWYATFRRELHVLSRCLCDWVGCLPDLRWSAMAATEQSWQAIVRDGALTDSGMIAFGDRLSDEEIEAIRTYVLRQAWLASRKRPRRSA